MKQEKLLNYSNLTEDQLSCKECSLQFNETKQFHLHMWFKHNVDLNPKPFIEQKSMKNKKSVSNESMVTCQIVNEENLTLEDDNLTKWPPCGRLV